MTNATPTTRRGSARYVASAARNVAPTGRRAGRAAVDGDGVLRATSESRRNLPERTDDRLPRGVGTGSPGRAKRVRTIGPTPVRRPACSREGDPMQQRGRIALAEGLGGHYDGWTVRRGA